MSPEYRPVLDAVLIHSYGYNEPHRSNVQDSLSINAADEIQQTPENIQEHGTTKVIYRPDLRERWTIRALEELLRTYDIRNVVFTGGHDYGTGAPPLGEIDAQEAERKLHLSTKGINVHIVTNKREGGEDTTIKDTSGEVIGFLQEARKNGWERLASLGTRTHSLSIEQLYKKRRQPVIVFSAEKVLKHSPNERRYKIIRGMHFSKDELVFMARESIKNILYRLPGGEEFLRNRAERKR